MQVISRSDRLKMELDAIRKAQKKTPTRPWKTNPTPHGKIFGNPNDNIEDTLGSVNKRY